MNIESFSYTHGKNYADQILINHHFLEEKKDDKKLIYFFHDLTDHQLYYDDFFFKLIKADPRFEVKMIDFKGFGRSSGGRGEVEKTGDLTGHIVHFLKKEKLEEIYNNYSQKMIMGTGLGGLVALSLFKNENSNFIKDFDSLVLVNPLIKLVRNNDNSLSRWKAVIGELLSDKFQMKLKIRGDQIFDCPFLSRKWDQDPLVNKKLSLTLVNEINYLQKQVIESSYLIDAKTLFFIGKDSIFSDIESVNLFHLGIGDKQKLVRYISSRTHSFLSGKHEKSIINDIVQWSAKI